VVDLLFLGPGAVARASGRLTGVLLQVPAQRCGVERTRET